MSHLTISSGRHVVLKIPVLLDEDIHLLPQLIDVLPLDLQVLHLQLLIFVAVRTTSASCTPVSHLDAHVLGAGAITSLELLELGILVPQL